jgi:aspartyl-tRNA(Asn)/glutamyl-tRNA(Gln) amidotransferase subunit A
MAETELCFLNVTELGPLIFRREISPVDIVKQMLVRIEELNGALRAYVHVSGECALAEARTAEIEICRGGYRGPLHGIPVAYKDIYDVRGLPTTAGSKVMDGYVAPEDCTVAAKLRQAGAICLGKLNTWEFASGSLEVFGETRNPWNTELITGGSSSGSATALAAHLITLATGTDTGGSIRTPASFCGVVGLKPTYGRISRSGVIPLSWSLDHIGPMARTVGDVALLLEVMAGPDRRDPSAAVQPVPNYSSALGTDLEGVRIGLPRSYFFEEADPEIAGAVRAAIETMQQLGVTVHEVDLPHVEHGSASMGAIAYTEAFAFHQDNFFTRPDDYTPDFLHKISSVAFLTAEEFVTSQRMRQIVTGEFLEALAEVNVIVTPTTSYPAYPIGSVSPESSMRRLTRPVNLTGLPALSVPCGFTSMGLPASMQLIGRAWDESTVLRIAHAYERATDWHKRRAPICVGGVTTSTPRVEYGAGLVDAQWVLDFARLVGLSFITPRNAEPIAAYLGPLKARLNLSRKQLEAGIEPPVRPAPT